MTAQLVYTDQMTIGFAGMLDNSERNDILAMRNDEAVDLGNDEIAFGTAVQRGSLTDHKSALQLTFTDQLVPGIHVHSHAFDKDLQLGEVGVKPGNKLSILQRGRARVICEEGCNVGDRLHIRAIATGSELPGALRSTPDGLNTIDATTQGKWESAASAGGLAWLRVDFVNKP